MSNKTQKLDTIRKRVEKLSVLLRYHRQRVFDPATGDTHHRALKRLQRTATWRRMCDDVEAHSRQLAGERLARMGY